MRASGRSILLITRITGSFASSALRSTNRVCGSGPSDASTSSSTPSTIVSPRSTSPPKSAWPGVSTMFSFTPRWWTAVFLARIVIPFSRSRSIESITRTATSWPSRKAPDCQSIASTSVVLPWSTWATIAMLRRSSLTAIRAGDGRGPAVAAPPRLWRDVTFGKLRCCKDRATVMYGPSPEPFARNSPEWHAFTENRVPDARTEMDPYQDSFQHEALFYAGDDEFLAGTLSFAQGAIERDEPVLIALGEHNTDLLRGALGRDAERAIFTPMETLGQNPARIIPAWRDFVAANTGADQPVRGIGEPIWAGRTDDEVVECHHHEALLNYAFDDGPAWWLLCPYDANG